MDLYKLAVEMADRISARRGVANSFFLSINTGLVAVLGAADLRWYVPVSGIAFCITWWALLKSYRELNTAKFEIIVRMEERLPERLFGEEWERLKRDSPHGGSGEEKQTRTWAGKLAGYRELGEIERIVPVVFSAIYVAELIRQGVG
ncbi:MAG: hypothetical protein JST53_07570 [Actinobacteria bacterium]|nr:hypothetical protein [Actinomycetota bacterium]